MSLFEGMERSEGMIKAVPAAPEKRLIDFCTSPCSYLLLLPNSFHPHLFLFYLLLLFTLFLTFASGVLLFVPLEGIITVLHVSFSHVTPSPYFNVAH